MTDTLYKDVSGKIYAVNPLQHPESGWVKLTPDEIDELNASQPTPAAVSRAQGKAALIQKGLWPSVLSYAESIEDDIQRALADVALNDTTHWQRSSPFLNAAATALGLSDSELDELFIEASKVEL